MYANCFAAVMDICKFEQNMSANTKGDPNCVLGRSQKSRLSGYIARCAYLNIIYLFATDAQHIPLHFIFISFSTYTFFEDQLFLNVFLVQFVDILYICMNEVYCLILYLFNHNHENHSDPAV